MSEISEAINNFFNFDVFDDESDKLYCCDSIVIYKNELYKSLKDNNDRNPHDDTAWFYIGTLSDIINYIIADDTNYQLDISYYPECEKTCKCIFSQGQCVVDRSQKLDINGMPLKDKCGKPIYEYLIYNSLIDCNSTTPKNGSQTNPPTWSQGMTTCEYLNRSIGYTQDGDNEAYIISALNRKCLLSCDSPDDETIALATQGTEGTHSQTVGNKLRVKHDNKSIISTPEKGLEVATSNGLIVTSNGIQVKPANNSVIVDANGVKVNIANGLELNSNGINVNLGSGTTFEPDGSLAIKPADNSIIVNGSGIKVNVIGKDLDGSEIIAKDTLLTPESLGTGLTINPLTNKVDLDACTAAITRTPDKNTRKTLFCDKDGFGSTPYEHCDYPTWSVGMQGANGYHIVKGSDEKYYIENPNGTPELNDPVTQNQGEVNWFGAYNSLCDLIRQHLGISAQSGNLLQFRKDGFYYGNQAPPELRIQYIDAINGIDENFTGSQFRGSREFPLKTIEFAVRRLPYGTEGGLYLHESQDHFVNLRFNVPNNLNINPYGEKYDELYANGDATNPNIAYCPSYYWVVGSYRYRNYKPRIVATTFVEYADINLTETFEAFTPLQSYKFHINGCKLITTKDPDPNSGKPYDKNRACFGSWSGNPGNFELYFCEVYLRDINAFNGTILTFGTFYLDRENRNGDTALIVKTPYLKNVSFNINPIDGDTLPPVPFSNCDTDNRQGVQIPITIESLFSGFSNQQQTIVGLNTDIPLNLIRP